MNIVSLSLCYPSPANPAAGSFVRLRLAALSTEHNVRVICPVLHPFAIPPARRAPEAVSSPPVQYVRMPYVPGLSQPLNPYLYARAAQSQLAAWMKHEPVDLLDAHFCWPDGVATARLARRFKVPYAVTLRGVLGRYATDRFKRPSIVRALCEAAAVIAVSQSLKDKAVQLGVPEDRISVIPNGVNGSTFHVGEQREARRTLHRDEREIILITVGHLCQRKGADRMLRMLPELIRRDERIRYVVVGAEAAEGRFETHLRKLTTRLELRDRVTFTGRLAPAGVARWLRAADLFVLPTANEGCCNAIHEALATGLPVVTTDVGGNREFVHADVGAIVPYGDDSAFLTAVLDRLRSTPNRTERVRRSPVRTWDAVARETADVLRRALERSRMTRRSVVGQPTPSHPTVAAGRR